DALGERIARLTGGRYHSRRHGAVPPHGRTEWRVVLDGKTLWIAIRPYAVPLHRRPWRQHTVPGSLHPPVAAAMARMSDLAPDHQVLDPFCGAGTLLLEAHHLEPHARYLGVDRDPAATAAARANSSAAAGTTHRRGDGSGNERRDALGGAKHHREEHGAERRAGVRGARHSEGAGVVWRCGDARWVEGAFDRVLSNPPWGVRVADADFPAVVRRWRDVLRPGGLLAAILMPEQAERIGRGWRVRARYDVAVAGRHPVILVAEPARA
ncbi:MAG: methyltransferase domain-containing protein, partial [Kribbellaceae bacterium]|nr:methyltransferase domain-containing protein [Kribbellaceae bacterium]